MKLSFNKCSSTPASKMISKSLEKDWTLRSVKKALIYQEGRKPV